MSNQIAASYKSTESQPMGSARSQLFRRAVWVIMFVLLFRPKTTSAQQEELTRFYSETGVTVTELSEGAVGAGTIVYFHNNEPRLAVRLSKARPAAVAVAEVYHTPPDMSQPRIVLHGDKLTFLLDATPALTITSLDGWWVRDGIRSFNLDMTTHGPIYALWSADVWQSWVGETEEAVHIQVRDASHSGLPQWELRRLLPMMSGKGVIRTQYAERRCHTTTILTDSVSPAWPYVAHGGGYEQKNGEFSPPIKVNWALGRLQAVAEFVTLRNQNCAYGLYSLKSLERQQINRANFETPFAFYDLSEAGVGYPNLILRTERFPANDRWSAGLKFEAQNGRLLPTDFQRIRYSWHNEVGDNRWSYKIEVMGIDAYDQATSIADGQFMIDAPAYDVFPSWVLGRKWPVVTFVDATASNFASNEGIYRWYPSQIGIGVLYGWSEPNKYAFTTIPPGYRGEYRADTNQQPYLYHSPIDQKIHLRDAQSGVWQVTTDHTIKMATLGPGAYINQWQAIVDEEPINTLYALHDHLLYEDDGGFRLKRVAYQPATIEFQPPSDHKSWQTVRAISDSIVERDPFRPITWLEAFEGPSLAFDDIAIEELRVTREGFRFRLTLPSQTTPRRNELLSNHIWAAGRYGIHYDGQQLHITPWTPPQLQLLIGKQGLLAKSAQILQKNEISFAVTNVGFADAHYVHVRLTTNEDQAPFASKTIRVLSGETTHVAFPWEPNAAGAVTLGIELQPLGFNNAQSVYHAAQIEVEQVAQESPRAPDHSFALLTMLPQTTLLLITLFITLHLIWQVTKART